MNKIGIVCIILLAAVPVLIIGIRGLLRERYIKFGWPVIQGAVVELLRPRYSRNARPVVEYQVNGERLRVKNAYSSSLYSFKPGQIINIRYNPENPGQCRIADDKVPLLPWGMFSALGACGVVVSFVVYAVL